MEQKTLSTSVQCYIYKGSKNPEAYLFMINEDDFSDVPDALLGLMGELEQVLSLELDEHRKLANADTATVLRQLQNQGYYLQLPPHHGNRVFS